MILLVFEGKTREPRIYKTVRELFFKDVVLDDIFVSYCSNIYSLYQQMKSLDVFGGGNSDVVRLLKQEMEKHPEIPNVLERFENSDAFSEIYLFFDYDIKRQDKKNAESVETQNAHIKEMLAFFNDETGNGKLYINYPMVESIRYFKNPLPDEDFYTYTTDLFIGKKFKQAADNDSFYKNLDFIAFRINKKTFELKRTTENNLQTIKKNWDMLKDVSVKKAHYICADINSAPPAKTAITQTSIFEGQINKYVAEQKISILNAFPLFLYEYFR